MPRLYYLAIILPGRGKLGKIILKEHLNHCVKEGIERGDVDILTRFNTVLDKYL